MTSSNFGYVKCGIPTGDIQKGSWIYGTGTKQPGYRNRSALATLILLRKALQIFSKIKSS